MFTVIGELINTTRKSIREKVKDRDAAFITEVTKKQEAAGATHIDVNVGGDPDTEVSDMEWIVPVVAEATSLPLSVDSTSAEALRAGLQLCNRPGTIINSITGEQERIDQVLPLVTEFNTGVVALAMDDSGMPEDLEGRTKITDDLAKTLTDAGVSLDRAYFDHLVRPAATNPGQAAFLLGAIRYTKTTYPESHIALGMSNISFGLPQRCNLNRAFLCMLVAAGCDGAIMDPCDEGTMLMLRASLAAMGVDAFGMEYLMAIRSA